MSFQIRRLKEEAKPSKMTTTLKWLQRARVPLGFLWLRAKKVKAEQEEAKQRRGLIAKIAISLGVIVLCTVGVVAGVKALIAMQILEVTQIVGVAGTPLATDEHGYTNFLLLGQGDASHDGVDLTDTIIIASIDPETESVAMISIPRDLYLNTSRMGAGRVNQLYRDFKYYLMQTEDLDEEQAGRAAMQELSFELSTLFGVKLHHVVKVDFIGFVQAVDAIGGVDIVVPEDLYDAEYPAATGYGYEVFSILEGPQHLDGETALKYARSRHSTSDFDRSRRQQDILQAMAEKARGDGTLTSPSRITELLRIMDEHVATTLTFREMVSLADMASNIDRSNILSVQFGFVGPGGFLYTPPREDYGGASVLIPSSWDDIRTFVSLILKDRPLYLDKTPIDVLNAGAPSGSSRNLGIELDRFALLVGETANYDGPDRLTSAIIAPKGHEDAARTLGTLLAIPDVTSFGEASTGTTIQVLLGEDYTYRGFPTPTATDTPLQQ